MAAQQRRRRRRAACATRYPVLVAGAARRRVGAAAQQGHRRRQPAAAHALPLFLRHRRAAATNASPASGCAAIGGFNRIHAILGASDACIATHPSDMAVALAALDAQVELLGADQAVTARRPRGLPPPAGRHAAHRDRAAAGRTDHGRRPAAAAARAAALPQGARPRFLRLRAGVGRGDRRVGRGTITAARVAFGGVAHKPWRATEAEAALIGRPASAATFRAAADAALAHAVGRGHNDFKIELARRTLYRTLAQAAQAE